MKIKEFKCSSCNNNDFKFMAHMSNRNLIGIYCSRCGKWFKWADKDEKNLMKLAEREDTYETVEVVIKLPKEEYDYMIANPTRYNICDDETLLYNYIKNGTVLPKGHGDLIDRDRLINRGLFMNNDNTTIKGIQYITKEMIKVAPIVIEADKEE